MCIERVRPKYPADDVPGLWQFTVRRPGGPDPFCAHATRSETQLATGCNDTPSQNKIPFSDNSKKGQALWVKAGRLESTVLSLTTRLLFRMCGLVMCPHLFGISAGVPCYPVFAKSLLTLLVCVCV